MPACIFSGKSFLSIDQRPVRRKYFPEKIHAGTQERPKENPKFRMYKNLHSYPKGEWYRRKKFCLAKSWHTKTQSQIARNRPWRTPGSLYVFTFPPSPHAPFSFFIKGGHSPRFPIFQLPTQFLQLPSEPWGYSAERPFS